LKSVDFSKYISNQNFNEDYPMKSELEYCEPTWIGKTGLQLSLDNSNKNKKAIL
jgi:hypothetical protein